MKTKIQKIIISLMLALCLVVSSPLAVIAQEVPSEPPPQEQTADPSPSPDASPSPSPEPEVSPSPDPATTEQQVVDPSPSPDPLAQEQQQVEDERAAELQEAEDERQAEWTEAMNEYYEEMGLTAAQSTNVVGGGNVGDTSITTGDATVGGAIITDTNRSSIESIPLIGSGCSICPAGDITLQNTGNGANSNSSTELNSNNNTGININNNADVDNNVNFNANTGDNGSSFNVGDTQITTGDANVTATLITSANQTGIGTAEFNVVDNHVGDIILAVPDNFLNTSSSCNCPGGDIVLENSGNGADSTNNIQANITNTNDTTIDNNGDITNDVNLNANSGNNQTSFNTAGDSAITTGDANVAANLINVINSTVSGGALFVVNVFGNLVGDIIFPDFAPTTVGGSNTTTLANSNNGEGSTNNTSLNTTNTNEFNMDNNAVIDNNLIIDANTGDNMASFNTAGDNVVETGEVNVNAEVVNIANINMLGSGSDPIWLVLVNNMGSWSGKIIGALTGSNFASGDGLDFTVGPDGSINIGNSGNGANSTNNAEANITNDNSFTVNNNANVTNNLNINANTGSNNAGFNTGGSSVIRTGDVNVAASVVNFVNTVLVGRPLMIGIINVFGSWTGDAVPPGEEPEAAAIGGANTQSLSDNNGDNSSSGGNSGISGSSNSGGISTNSNFAVDPQGSDQTPPNAGLLGSILGGYTGTSNNQNEGDSEKSYTTPLVFGSPLDGINSPNEKIMLFSIPLLFGAYFLLRRIKSTSRS